MKNHSSFRSFASLVICFTLMGGVIHAGPFEKTTEKLDIRVRRAAERFIEMQADPAKRIPADLISKARGIIILHKVKAGLLIGGEAGNGVALVRNRETGAWSAPAFVSSAEGSYGLQLGAQESDLIFLLMNETGLKPLLGGGVNVGVDVAATAGPVEESGNIDTMTLNSPILVYSTPGVSSLERPSREAPLCPPKRTTSLSINAR
jgi:lipid-binding SYLF domain-containing protein